MIGAGLVVVVVGLLALRASEAPASGPDATALTVAADAAHAEGRSAEAADLYIRAYGAMTPQEKDVLGDVLVTAALEDLRTSHRDTPDAGTVAAARELLDAYERDTGRELAEAGTHRTWIEAATPVDDEVPNPVASAALLRVETPRPRRERDGDPGTRDPHRDRPSDDRDREVAGPVLLGVGLAGTIAGAALIGVGASAGRKARRTREESLDDPRFTSLPPDDPRRTPYIAAYEDYVQGEQNRGLGLAAAGSVLAAIGVGLVVYGTVRLVAHRRRSRQTARIRPVRAGLAF